MVIVSDSSPLISFAGIKKIDLLQKLFPEGIFIPNAVWAEVTTGDLGKDCIVKAQLEKWITIEPISDSKHAMLLEINGLDKGEAEAIVLAIEKNALLLVDEHEARKEARTSMLLFTGTVGCLLKAKQKGFIVSVKNLLDDMRNTTSFRISTELYNDILSKVQEI